MKTKKFKYEAPIGMFLKKHYCPECSAILKAKKVKRVINSESDEAKDFDFSTGDGPELIEGRLVGDVEFTWYVYHCDNCNIEITNKDMRRHEREKKEGNVLGKIETMNITNNRIPVKHLYSANPFYVHFKKHYCHQCKSPMKIKYISKIVNSSSSEAVHFDFSIPDGRLIGDVEFRTSFFHCQNCGFEIPFDEMKKLDKSKRKSP